MNMCRAHTHNIQIPPLSLHQYSRGIVRLLVHMQVPPIFRQLSHLSHLLVFHVTAVGLEPHFSSMLDSLTTNLEVLCVCTILWSDTLTGGLVESAEHLIHVALDSDTCGAGTLPMQVCCLQHVLHW